MRIILILLLPCVLSSGSAYAASFGYQWPGFHLADSALTADIKFRAQLRATDTKSYDSDFDESDEVTEKSVNRARLKIGGNLGADWISYYTEYDFPSNRLLDLRVTAGFNDNKNSVRLGQWKVPYNRERIDSSGKQQFVDRSIANKWFTLDRQRGVALSGRLAKHSRKDSWYHLAVLEGTGRNGEGSATSPMVLGRWEWNFLGRDVGFSQSDTQKRQAPAASISLGAARYHGPYTSFSSFGGGNLPGFEPGDDDRYKVRQYMVESVYQYAGLSWQQEYHLKQIKDTKTKITRKLSGGYLQTGYFPHGLLEWVPAPLEIALRYAQVDPDEDISDDQQTEVSLVCNWFFSGHDNKLSLEVNRFLDNSDLSGGFRQTVVRLQWDFHL